MADESVCQGLCLAVLHRLTKGGGRQGWTELCEREELLHGHIRLHGHCWLPWNFRSRTNLLIVWNKWADQEECKHIKTVEHKPTCKVKHIVSINHSWHDDCRFMHVKLETIASISSSYLLFVWLDLCFWWLDYQNATKHFPAFLGYLSRQQPCFDLSNQVLSTATAHQWFTPYSLLSLSPLRPVGKSSRLRHVDTILIKRHFGDSTAHMKSLY